MEFETIKYEKEDGFVLVTLNRPKSLNALNVKMWNELDQAMNLFTADSEAKVIIYTGAPRPDGRPCFCAGADLKEVSGFQSEGGQVVTGPGWTPVNQFWDMRRPKQALVGDAGEHMLVPEDHYSRDRRYMYGRRYRADP